MGRVYLSLNLQPECKEYVLMYVHVFDWNGLMWLENKFYQIEQIMVKYKLDTRQ